MAVFVCTFLFAEKFQPFSETEEICPISITRNVHTRHLCHAFQASALVSGWNRFQAFLEVFCWFELAQFDAGVFFSTPVYKISVYKKRALCLHISFLVGIAFTMIRADWLHTFSLKFKMLVETTFGGCTLLKSFTSTWIKTKAGFVLMIFSSFETAQEQVTPPKPYHYINCSAVYGPLWLECWPITTQ
jgi:hypothetical protein